MQSKLPPTHQLAESAVGVREAAKFLGIILETFQLIIL